MTFKGPFQPKTFHDSVKITFSQVLLVHMSLCYLDSHPYEATGKDYGKFAKNNEAKLDARFDSHATFGELNHHLSLLVFPQATP